MTHRIGYLIGSLASDSINRVLATALVRLAPPDLELVEIPIRDLPPYNRTVCCSCRRSTTAPSPAR